MRLLGTLKCGRCNGFVLWRLEGIRLMIMSTKDKTPDKGGCFQLLDRDPCMASEVIINENLSFVPPLNDKEMV